MGDGLTVGGYARISDDTEETGLGVVRQEEDGRLLARARHWQVAEPYYVDNDLSAFKRTVVRPAFERMLKDLREGRIDGIVAYDLDRVARQPRDVERIIDIYDDRARAGRPAVWATVQGEADLASSDGRTMARVLVAMANKSSMDTSRRVKRVHLANALSGKPVGRGRSFGWKPDKVTIDPVEAAMVRAAVKRLLAGGTLAGVVSDWNAAGVLTSRGNPWITTTLRRYLLSPRLAGFRVHQGRLARAADGTPVSGWQEPILDVDTWEALCVTLSAPERLVHGHRHGRTPVAELSGGLLRCAKCGTALRMSPSSGRRFYSCPRPGSARHGCGGTTVRAEPVEELIRDLVLRLLAEDHVEHVPALWPRENELADLDGQVGELQRAMLSGVLKAERAIPMIADLDRRIDVLRAERAVFLRAQTREASLPGQVSRGEWDLLRPDERRALIGSKLRMILVKPATMRGRFLPSRIVPLPLE